MFGWFSAISDKVKIKVFRRPDSGRGRPAQMWPTASNVSKLTPTWPENLFWTASYPVEPGKLGWGRAEVSAPGPNIISLARPFHR